jgi:hypothetical protein
VPDKGNLTVMEGWVNLRAKTWSTEEVLSVANII